MLKLTHRRAAPGAKSDIYDCLILVLNNGTHTSYGDNEFFPKELFLPRVAMLARYMLSSCVCPSARRSVLQSQRLNVESRRQRHTIGQ